MLRQALAGLTFAQTLSPCPILSGKKWSGTVWKSAPQKLVVYSQAEMDARKPSGEWKTWKKVR
jgi:hypothetical protein